MPKKLILIAGLPVFVALAAALPIKAGAGQPDIPFAENKSISLPIDCTPGTDCWLPNYVDADPGAGASDYTGGVRTYDGHKGVDFAIRDRRAMARGVSVLAAAAGVVMAIRDDMPDINFKLLKPKALKGKECGNAVVVRHDADWRTQYCHMREGSIRVRKGQRIKAGTRLGLVGLSGKSEFPHLHFMIFYKGVQVDPFTGRSIKTGDKVGPPLWQAAARARLPYRATNIYHAGFSAEKPRFIAARRGDYRSDKLASPVKTLFVWMDIFGIHNADRLTLRLFGPDGTQQAERRVNMKLKKPRARQFLQFGFKHPRGTWPAGAYRGEMILSRQLSDGLKTYRASRRVTIN
ncbi:MAG: M23 family metallopeptidase [Rhodospirillales bacterium]|nr:peptidase M23 [Rhodospirillaceae bacterium]MDP6430422.1 M23 family metallopeptidase [Rhodospirillales bacterium]MDP6642697.1 M23 family metallopeptidase [Rhodospirillales bacterium]MDP6842523.1 M23 family metallopeptidase [Rhodospirillales bacterium]